MPQNPFKLLLVPMREFFSGVRDATYGLKAQPQPVFPQHTPPPTPPSDQRLVQPVKQQHFAFNALPFHDVDLPGSDPTISSNSKETTDMYANPSVPQTHDLSGSDVKVVIYTVVSVATGITDTARILFRQPKMIAFGDDLTSADFTAWILSLRSTQQEVYRTALKVCDPQYDLTTHAGPFGCPPSVTPCSDEDPEPAPPERHIPCDPKFSILCDPKFHRVAFIVVGRFSVADINWSEMQALATAEIAKKVGRIESEVSTFKDYPPAVPVKIVKKKHDHPSKRGK
ncbi:MAG: hypothetical protein AAF560_25520 [Acidobacteriota bacterium]